MLASHGQTTGLLPLGQRAISVPRAVHSMKLWEAEIRAKGLAEALGWIYNSESVPRYQKGYIIEDTGKRTHAWSHRPESLGNRSAQPLIQTDKQPWIGHGRFYCLLNGSHLWTLWSQQGPSAVQTVGTRRWAGLRC